MRRAKPEDAERCLELMQDTGCYVIEAARTIGCDQSILSALLKTEPFAERYAEAKRNGAKRCEQMALEAILAIPDDGTPAQIAKARELAQHHRWGAKMRDQKHYSEKVEHDHSGNASITIKVIQFSQPEPDKLTIDVTPPVDKIE